MNYATAWFNFCILNKFWLTRMLNISIIHNDSFKLLKICHLVVRLTVVSVLYSYKKYRYNDDIMSTIASQTNSLTIVYSTIYSGADQRKHQSSMSLASVRGIHRWPVNSPQKGPVPRKIFPFDDVIMKNIIAADVPAPVVARSTVVMVLNIKDNKSLFSTTCTV